LVHKSEICFKFKCTEFQNSGKEIIRFQNIITKISKISNGFQNPKTHTLYIYIYTHLLDLNIYLTLFIYKVIVLSFYDGFSKVEPIWNFSTKIRINFKTKIYYYSWTLTLFNYESLFYWFSKVSVQGIVLDTVIYWLDGLKMFTIMSRVT